MKRRGAIFALSLTAACAVSLVSDPSATRADEQEQKLARIGFVGPDAPSTAPPSAKVLWERLHELGYVEGKNLAVEVRWAEGRHERLPALMNEMVASKIDVLVTYSTQAAEAAKKATSTIPIVVAVMGDPIRSGLAVSLAHPGHNLTGLSMGATEGMAGKWLELLQEAVPRLSTVAVIENPDNAPNRIKIKELEAIAPTRGLKLRVLEVREPGALERAFEQAGQQTQGVLLLPDFVFASNRTRVTALAAKHRLPAMYGLLDFVEAGGLMAYGPDTASMFRRAAEYIDKILKGSKPAELPIEQPTKYVLAVNLKTAKALGITIPESILLRADEVIR